MRDSALRRRGLMAFAYSATQTAALAYLVSFLNLEIDMSLTAAGSVLALSQVGGVTGRILLGLAADLWIRPGLQLGLAGIATAACGMALAAITPQWSYAAVSVLCALFGALSFAWIGVFHAETASVAPPGQIGRLTGGMQVFISLGATLGPAAFSLILALTGSFSLAFAAIALPTLAVGMSFTHAALPRHRNTPADHDRSGAGGKPRA
jgi:MFS family permease